MHRTYNVPAFRILLRDVLEANICNNFKERSTAAILLAHFQFDCNMHTRLEITLLHIL